MGLFRCLAFRFCVIDAGACWKGERPARLEGELRTTSLLSREDDGTVNFNWLRGIFLTMSTISSKGFGL